MSTFNGREAAAMLRFYTVNPNCPDEMADAIHALLDHTLRLEQYVTLMKTAQANALRDVPEFAVLGNPMIEGRKKNG